jgi:signal transduction histidine kinase
MGDWVLPSLSQVLDHTSSNSHLGLSMAQRQQRAHREWRGAVLALESLLHSDLSKVEGIMLCGPAPVISQPQLLQPLHNWTFTAHPFAGALGLARKLAPAATAFVTGELTGDPTGEIGQTISLVPQDCLAAEQFSVLITSAFSLVILLGRNSEGQAQFWFSFDPDRVDRIWQILRLRVVMLNPQHVANLDAQIAQFPTQTPPYQIVSQFTQSLLAYLPEPQEILPPQTHLDENLLANAVRRVTEQAKCVSAANSSDLLDVDLLQAFAHEVRTPLTTIRTLTKSLLKRLELSPEVVKRLEMIDRECSEQIDRFGLIFRAVELETGPKPGMSLTAINLDQLFAQSIPRWQKQANQRGLTLDILLPQHLPAVMTDPSMLDQALTSLIERSARSLPSGSSIQVEVTVAGHQLKLQVETTTSHISGDPKPHRPLLKSLGQILMFQPETGNVSLNLAVTKNLFQAMGGKMTVRQREAEGEVLTIFLPIERSRSSRSS